MSNSENINYSIKLTTDQSDSFTELRIFDGRNQLKSNGIHSLETFLPKGFYTVEAELNGKTTRKLIKHDSDQVVKIDLPERFSSIPVEGMKSSDRVYVNAASEISKRITFELQIDSNDDSGKVFIFLRYPRKSLYEEIGKTKHFDGYYLLNHKKEKVVDLNSDSSVIGDSGYLAFSAKIQVGQYYLCYDQGKYRLKFPIYVFQSWQTQFFLTVRESPISSSCRVLMNKYSFQADSRDAKAIDSVFNMIQNENYQLKKEVRERLVYGKWENPIMGLLWIHLYFNSESNENDYLFNQVWRNLSYKILGDSNSPDVKALELMKILHEGEEVSKDLKFNHPPMFLTALKNVINVSPNYPWIIPEGSEIDLIAAHLPAHSGCVSFQTPYAIEESNFSKRKLSGNRSIANLFNVSVSTDENLKRATDVSLLASAMDTIQYRKKHNYPLSIKHIAEDLNLPPSTIERQIGGFINELTGSSQLENKTMNWIEKIMDKDISETSTVKLLTSIDGLEHNYLEYFKIDNVISGLLESNIQLNKAARIKELLNDSNTDSSSLTKQERKVAELTIAGLTVEQIATELKVQRKTVRKYRREILRKLS